MLQIGPACKRVSPISECLTEVDIEYGGTVLWNSWMQDQKSQSAEICQLSCKSKGLHYFIYQPGSDVSCKCINSIAGKSQVVRSVSGEASCSASRGKITFKKREMVCWLIFKIYSKFIFFLSDLFPQKCIC